MGRDVLEIVQSMDRRGVEWQMAMQCAPLIMGLKISNLMMLPRECEADVLAFLETTDLSSFLLHRTEHRVSLLLFRAGALQDYLRQPEITAILRDAGYPEGDLPELLEIMKERYAANRSRNDGFPHEMGVFLGYPAEDVRGFMEKRQFLYSGYWRVYGHVEEKKRIFRAYENARDTLIQLLHEGLSLTEILAI